jgi:hypothetical protein
MMAPLAALPAEWELWTDGGPLIAEARGFKPRLASWNRSDHPDQIRLRDYLWELSLELGPLKAAQPLFLNMTIDVEKPEHLERHHDLENYLTPLIAHLGPRQFRYVEASKRVGGGSSLEVGLAVPLTDLRVFLARAETLLMCRWRGGTREAMEGTRSHRP